MKKQLMIVGIILVLLVVGLSGCTDENDRFVGTWIDEDNLTYSFTFFSDGSLTYTVFGNETQSTYSINGTYEIKNGKFNFTLFVDGVPYYYPPATYYKFSNNDNTLTLTDIVTHGTTIYTKQ